MKNLLLSCTVFLFLFSCTKEESPQLRSSTPPVNVPGPNIPPSLTDPLAAYCGNYRFTITDSTYTSMSGVWTVSTSQDSGYIHPVDSITYIIRYRSFDSLQVRVYNLQNPGQIYPVNYSQNYFGGFTSNTQLHFKCIRSQSPSHSFWVRLDGVKY